MIATQDNQAQDFRDLRLEPAQPDLLSVKTQIVGAAILSLLLTLIVYWPALKIGFLLDDFLHLDQVARFVLKGDFHDFLANFYGNWGGSDLMKSYRPLVSLSFLADFLLYRAEAIGFHLTNLILSAGCSLFVALIASELSGNFGNRIRAVTALWAALLFAASPLHVESVAWITGRVDLLSTLFYLASLYFFMRLGRIEEPQYIGLCVASFILSLFSKEMAVTLPVVATLLALLVNRQESRTDNKNKIAGLFYRPSTLEWKALAMLWLALAAFAVLRTVILGNTIGGYGGNNLLSDFYHFADKASLLRIIIPTNEEILPASSRVMALALVPYGGAVALAAIRCLATPALTRIFIFLALWAAIGVLPAFQIWNIAPNLMGSRLFFLSSSAVSLLFAFAFIAGEDRLDSKRTRLLTVIGTVFLSYTLIVSCYFTRSNLTAYITAGQMIERLKAELTRHRQNSIQKCLLLNLPSDYHGGPMIRRPKYFNFMLSEPFSKETIASAFTTAEADPPGDRRFFDQDRLNLVLQQSPQADILLWSDATGETVKWQIPTGPGGFECAFNRGEGLKIKPETTRIAEGGQWHLFNTLYPEAVRLVDGLRLYAGSLNSPGLTAMLPVNNANPLKTPLVKIKMRIRTETASALASRFRFTWQQEHAVLSTNKLAEIIQTGSDQYECPLVNNKEWLLGGQVSAAGLSMAYMSDYADLISVEGISQEKCTPVLTEKKDATSNKSIYLVDASKVTGACSTLLLLTRPDTVFDGTIDEHVLPQYRALHFDEKKKILAPLNSALTARLETSLYCQKPAGSFHLPEEFEQDGKAREVLSIALDKDGAMIGLPSRALKVK